jgi:hypothetical protein
MAEENWQEELRRAFDELTRIEKRKKETLADLGHFYEFIAEPAFESLVQELRSYKIRARYGQTKGRSILFVMNFPGSRIDSFHYSLVLPRNSVELKLGLRLKGRRSPRALLEEREVAFLEAVPPAEVLKMSKETLILDIIHRYEDFMREARTSPA